MISILATVNQLKAQWAIPKVAIHKDEPCPFPIVCTFDSIPVSEQVLDAFTKALPKDIRDFWGVARNASLFKDSMYGQWGIEVLSPEEAQSETETQIQLRPLDFRETDLVLARFYGDSDLVVIDCDPKSNIYGAVIIAGPIDKRQVWPVAAKSFAVFLERLTAFQGDKFWELNRL